MIPRSFRIRDFRSITDSGLCSLSGDNITVLAGQNEAGKTAILMALRDFDLEEGEPPQTPEFIPEGRFDAIPSVSVHFELDDLDKVIEGIEEDGYFLPSAVIDHLHSTKRLTITRELMPGQFYLDPSVVELWNESEMPSEEAVANANVPKLISASEFAGLLRSYWPIFIYFDSFADVLPREVDMELLLPPKRRKSGSSSSPPTTKPQGDAPAAVGQTASPPNTSASSQLDVEPPAITTTQSPTESIRKSAPQPVADFVTLSGIDIPFINSIASQDKALENYLEKCSTTITGDFLTYWKQQVDGRQDVKLHVRHLRDGEGRLKLAFYVRDQVNQYPEQRSKGFLWFLSFYLRLAATEKREQRTKRLLLIDEPGSYLHARAQRDVLHLFEHRIASQQQIIYTTHSPYLLPSDKLYRLRVVLKKSEKGTLVLDRLTHPDLQGQEYIDTLSPIITSIGLDVRDALTFVKGKNILVEGMSDLIYLSAWIRRYAPNIAEQFNILPGSSATTIPTLASLFVGWGIPFVVMVDRDDMGNRTRDKLVKDLSIPSGRIVQPKGAVATEDVFDEADFGHLLMQLDVKLTINSSETPTKAIKRQKVDKILLARRFAELENSNATIVGAATESRIKDLLSAIEIADTVR